MLTACAAAVSSSQKAALKDVLDSLRSKEREADRLEEKIETHEQKVSLSRSGASSTCNRMLTEEKEENMEAALDPCMFDCSYKAFLNMCFSCTLLVHIVSKQHASASRLFASFPAAQAAVQ